MTTKPETLRVERLLERDERVLWKDIPVKRSFILATWSSIHFGPVFLGFSVFALWASRGTDGGGFFAVLFPFLLVGVAHF